MAYRRVPFAPNEWYHLYSRGIDKRIVFTSEQDFKRFRALLYLCNNTDAVNFEFLKEIPYEDIFVLPRKKTIVAVGAYCLMKNHPHLIVQEKVEGGITTFMRKLGTAYTMYFNKKYERIGNLMVRPFRSKHINNDRYLRYVVQYVHLNPAEVFEPEWKSGYVKSIKTLEEKLLNYKYSSLPDYFLGERSEQKILDFETFQLLKDNLPNLKDILNEAVDYYYEVENDIAIRSNGRPAKGR